MIKKLVLLFAVILFLGLLFPQEALGQACGEGYPECVNDCTACWVNSDCSYGSCWEDTNCGNCYVPPPQECNQAWEPCDHAYYGSNFCCASGQQGNNVCNYEYVYRWNFDCSECGIPGDPIAWELNRVRHYCGNAPSCGVCIAGQTQTETRFNTSCATSTCGGNTCARDVDRQERTLTCNGDCGGWSVTQDWHDVDSYPECPANNECGTSSQSGSSCYSPPGHTHTYGCVNNSCAHTDTGSNTDPNCGGQCAPPPPPPPQKYSCSGSSCIVDANGPYTASNCNNACSAPPGGCSVGWTLSNENPQPNSNIQVKVRGLSDPQGWSNIGLYLDNSPAGSWGGIENPWPTFVYNNVPARSSGGHTLEFRTNNGSRTCAPSKTFTTVSTTPTNLAVSGQPSCALAPYSVTFSWQNTNSTLWLDVSENPQFNGFANKNVSNLTSTNSSGFTLAPGRTYYWRLWNGSEHIAGPNFSVPLCVPPAPTGLAASCPVPGNNASLSWTPVAEAASYQITVNGTVTTSSTSSIPSYQTKSGDSYSWEVTACNSAGCSTPSSGAGFLCLPPPCPAGLGACGDFIPSSSSIGVCSGGNWQPDPGLTAVTGAQLGHNAWCRINANPTRGFCYQCNTAVSPWIQVTGDVHSQKNINAPGGPR